MTIEDFSRKLKTIFNSKFSDYYNYNSVVTIKEKDKGAKRINIVRLSGKNVIEIKTESLEKMSFLFPKTESHPIAKICDGIILLKDESSFHIKLIELKDTFSDNALKTALIQFEATNSKLKLILEFIEGFELPVDMECIIVSQLPTDYFERLVIASKSANHSVNKYYNLAKNKPVNLCIRDGCSHEWPIKEKYRFNKIPVRLIQGNNQLVAL